jgi:hypothetical protein
MVSHLLYYQLALLAILWLFVMLHVTWQGHSVFVEALHDRFSEAIKGCVRGGALLAQHPPREPQP